MKPGTDSQETAMVRVMVVEDHEDLRHLLVSKIDREPDLQVVAQAESVGEARQQASSMNCDVAILDTRLPDGYGADLIAELRELCPGMAVVILSASMHSASLRRAHRAGADEVMDKLDALEEIADAIRRV
jgi:DNA-binding NarL/FixJ family response regulator